MVGDTIAHASLAGVAIGLLIGVDPILTAAAVAVFTAVLLPTLTKSSTLPVDSILGFVLPFSMAIGVILLALIPGFQPELISYLFGSILSISWLHVLVISGLSVASLIILYVMYKTVLFVSFDEIYAKTAGVNIQRTNTIFSFILALTIVVGIQLVGIVLLNALLVIPASFVRLFSRSLRDMFMFTPLVSVLLVVGGIWVSFIVDMPTGPVIAVLAGLLFLAGVTVKKLS
jgi:zinc transport system permease protein